MKHDNDDNALRFLSVCSGIEAASVAWSPLGWQAVAFSEIEKFPSAVLAHHYPDVPNLGDFTKIDTSALGRVDILCGGTPCQAFSIAGARRSLEDARGNLTLAFVELAHELAAGNGLRNAVWENVPGVISTKDNAFGCFLAGLVGADDTLLPPDGHKWPNAGMVAGPRARAAWRFLDAQYFGLAQRRKRVIVIADFGNGADPAAVLFERKSLSGNTPPRRSSQKSLTRDVAPSLRAQSNCSLRDDSDAYVAVSSSGDVSHCLNAGGMGRQDYETETMIAVAGAICKDSFTGGAGGRPEGAAAGHFIPIAFDARQSDVLVYGDKAGPIDTGIPPISICAPLNTQMGLRGADTSNTNREGVGIGEIGDPAFTLQAAHSHAVITSWAVRRLTPTECERLQGFPDGYTNIPVGKKMAADGPRYKALGNSWAVPKFRWVGERIERLMPKAANDNHCSNTLWPSA
ncbi:DNA cytosine methyltransferase [Brucella pituitosa]|uniref:DNA cytosine methyltransferase n=1 Tax=Brucella pituitosa TaxID=571256 RepID=UPI003F4AAE4C